ncbi:Bro-N domain-containing protein [Bacteroides faecis]|uniref:BRO-N domain-containing protein n=1 Tax=Bacteroides faecis TaxID=674529 RepID=UPI0022E57748|nr:BRO family protein [Bacteroides faecis]
MEAKNNNQQTTGLQTFFNRNIGSEIRVKMIGEMPWFVGIDVASSLGYAKARNAISQHVDNEDALKQGVSDSQGFIRETTLINESGMYALIFGSKLPAAKAFKRWITSEVLPTIRRTGSYSLQSPQRQLLPAPKFRPAFIKWKERNRKFLSRKELFAIANGFRLTYSHVRKVYSGNTVSARVLDALIKAARKNREAGIEYPEHTTYERLLFEWEEMQ